MDCFIYASLPYRTYPLNQLLNVISQLNVWTLVNCISVAPSICEGKLLLSHQVISGALRIHLHLWKHQTLVVRDTPLNGPQNRCQLDTPNPTSQGFLGWGFGLSISVTLVMLKLLSCCFSNRICWQNPLTGYLQRFF